MPRLKDITGQQFGSLTVTRKAASIPRNHNAQWECRCECGATVVADAGNLKSGRTKSCGAALHRPKKYALRRDYKGDAHAALRRIWGKMVQRCTNSNNHDYAMYGGRGVRVCERWRKLSNFIADMGERPSPQHSLDRYPNRDGNYEPGNVRWATATQQANNRCSNRILSAFGRSMTMAEWSREIGVSQDAIEQRLRVLKWPVEKALSR